LRNVSASILKQTRSDQRSDSAAIAQPSIASRCASITHYLHIDCIPIAKLLQIDFEAIKE
jgi:hypothetical protein